MPETVNCNLCRGAEHVVLTFETQVLRLPPPYRVVRCRSCGLEFMSPRPTSEECEDLYVHQYFEGEQGYLARLESQGYKAGRYNRLSQLFDEPKEDLLEIGCATGHYLYELHQRGWNTQGIEISPIAAQYARDTFGLDVWTGRFEDYPGAPESFDVVIISNVLEHLPDPMQALLKIHSILRHRGTVVLEVPNQFHNLYHLLTKPWQKWRARNRAPFIYHAYFFTPKHIRDMMKQAGFRVLSSRTYREQMCIESAFPGGKFLRNIVYRLGAYFDKGPLIEIYAAKSWY